MRFGVIGHQAVPDTVARVVEARTKSRFGEHAGATLVTTLRPGATQMVARMALASGCALEVIVPSAAYDSMSVAAEDLEDYRGLVGRATAVETLPYPQPTEDAFRAAGRKVVDRSDVVFAIWDGRPARRPSGTAELVRYAKEQGRSVEVIWVKKLFLSYSFADARLVGRVHYHLRKQPAVEAYFWGRDAKPDVTTWADQVGAALEGSGAVVAFAGSVEGETQVREIQEAQRSGLPVCLVCLNGSAPTWARMLATGDNVESTSPTPSERALDYAMGIVRSCKVDWVYDDGLPLTYLFHYEKDVIEAYASGPIDDEGFGAGAPDEWPEVPRKRPHVRPNNVPAELIGSNRSDSDVIVDARAAVAADGGRALTFPEALPHRGLHQPIGASLNVRVLVSGGVAPGTNAVISEIARRHQKYAAYDHHNLDVSGYLEGFRGLLGANPHAVVNLLDADYREHSSRGGSRLGTSRAGELLGTDLHGRRSLQQMVGMLAGVHILYVIGGDGSMRAAHALAAVATQMDSPLAVIGVPKTTDNDILWVWRSVGHVSSVQRAREFVLDLHTEVTSNPRLCVIQLFGSDSGFVVADAGVASNVCNAVLVPEAPFSMPKVSAHLTAHLRRQQKRHEMPHGLVLMAETAIPSDAEDYLTDETVQLTAAERAAIEQFLRNGRRVRGQTPDDLRSAGMRIVTRVLQRDIRAMGGYWESFRVFSNEPRHLIRSMPPSASDMVYAERLGAHAVDAAMAGFYDCMVSQWLTEFVLVPLAIVVLGRKRLPLGGAFWSSVLASTEQPDFQP